MVLLAGVPSYHPSGDETHGVSGTGHAHQSNLQAPDGTGSERWGPGRQHLMQAQSDIFLGWTRSPGPDKVKPHHPPTGELHQAITGAVRHPRRW